MTKSPKVAERDKHNSNLSYVGNNTLRFSNPNNIYYDSSNVNHPGNQVVQDFEYQNENELAIQDDVY